MQRHDTPPEWTQMDLRNRRPNVTVGLAQIPNHPPQKVQNSSLERMQTALLVTDSMIQMESTAFYMLPRSALVVFWRHLLGADQILHCTPNYEKSMESMTFIQPGKLPIEWLRERLMGSANADGQFVDICGATSIATLRGKLSKLLIDLHIPDLDASVLLSSSPRSLTQNVSAIIFKEGHDGIRYLSKHGLDIENWVLFEPAHLSNQIAHEIQIDDPDLLKAFDMFKLEIEP
jgi:hypothetical protein